MKNKSLYILLFAVSCLCAGSFAQKHTFEIKDGNFLYDQKPIAIYSGEMHYSRIPALYWRHRFKMVKAMGLNAITTYVFWNHHELSPGKWDWQTSTRNLREYIKMAGEEGLMVILRPGPYACGEWEFGGYPWWLQNVKGLELRTYNKAFLDSCNTYIQQLANQLKDLQVTHGGPIIMVQVENEFGSYVTQRKDIPLETHKKYSKAIHQQLLDAGFDVPMFTCDGSWAFEGGTIEGLLPTANGEGSVKRLQDVVNQYHGGKGPYMIGEFYSGWLDHWKESFKRTHLNSVVHRTKMYMDGGVSFSMYMVHGGTNFGFTAGANFSNERNIQPDLTSYDYDAPISEAGWATPKYDSLRALMQKYVHYDIPPVPKKIPVISIPKIKFSKTANLFSVIEGMTPVESETPLTFEQLNQGSGYVLYRRHFNQPLAGLMNVKGIADYAVVYVNGEKIGELNRVTGQDRINVDIPFNATLDILVENMGRINYGARITKNTKGIIEPITIAGHEIEGEWQMYCLPMTEMPDMKNMEEEYTAGIPTLYGATFNVERTGDTFLNMESWGKGIVFVNGINLGRYWNVGPQQTLYLPGCFLKKGKNRIVVFEQLNERKQEFVEGVTEPILDKLKK